MSPDPKIPRLTDLIEKGVEIKLSELGLDQDPPIDLGRMPEPGRDHTALEQEIRRILDEHMELAWQEIRNLIRKDGDGSSSS